MRLPEVQSITNERPYDPLPNFLQQIEQEETKQTFYLMAKRILDFCIAFVLILISAPLMLIIAIGIKLTSKGPVFFTQERVGKGGKSFTFVKFRTMIPNADNSIHRDYMNKLIRGEAEGHQDNENAPLFKLKNDPRITEFGHFLRRTSLDEIPQLVNVLTGSMSLVGPRPPIPYEVQEYNSWHLQRLSVKPGVTGLWQVSGRSRTTFEEMVRLDIQYIENRSLLTDVKILFQTIPATLNTKTAA